MLCVCSSLVVRDCEFEKCEVLQKSHVVDESDEDMEEEEEEDEGAKVNVEEEEEDEIIESDVELEGEIVEPDNDPPQKVCCVFKVFLN